MSTEGYELHQAAQRQDIDELRNVLGQGADLDARDDSGITPLHYALRTGNSEVVELLLAYGADPNVTDKPGQTPLHYIVRYGQNTDVPVVFGDRPRSKEILIQLLLEHGADPNTQDASGSTPLHFAAQLDESQTARLLLYADADRDIRDNEGNTPASRMPASDQDQSYLRGLLTDSPMPEIFFPEEFVPLYPININGNELRQLDSRLNRGFAGKYVLVQSWFRLGANDKLDLSSQGIQSLDYVSHNTYLCRNDDKSRNLQEICILSGPVVYADSYRNELKITSDLQEARTSTKSQEFDVDVIFHESVNLESDEASRLQTEIKEKSQCGDESFELLTHKARLTMMGRYLDDVATIVDVRRIEEVKRVVARNDVARHILKIDTANQSLPYEGEGQLIAIADSGLDRGYKPQVPNHEAFKNRVKSWYTVTRETADYDGHGTHVAGSAIGDGKFKNGHRIRGTAPRAKLLVQNISIWDPEKKECGFRPPSTLGTLFDKAYEKGETARVHSDSWGADCAVVDLNNIAIAYRQFAYDASAGEIDEYIFDHIDMVICWAAGNDGRLEPINPFDRGQISSEAAAKNCITVGASGSPRSERNSDENAVADFSSRGPIKFEKERKSLPDRYKPDLVAPGASIVSVKSAMLDTNSEYDGNLDWHPLSGTSMATPLVAGCAAVLREALSKRTEPITKPSAALVKALFVNGAEILVPVGTRFVPNNSSGFGRVNMASSLAIVHGSDDTFFGEESLSNDSLESTMWRTTIEQIPASRTTFKVTLVWSDPSGEHIINDLHLIVQQGQRKLGGIRNNNVQQVMIKDPPSEPIDVTVQVFGTTRTNFALLNRSPQPFAVVWQFY